MPISFKQTQHPIQKLPTGESSFIQSFRFQGGPGPNIYIQANLHGPEILGTPLIGLLIDYLKSLDHINGSITLVPCANPLGVRESSIALDGRWNKKSGHNWNRIFSVDHRWRCAKEKSAHYRNLLDTHNVSIEEKLTAVLQTIAGIPDYVIDLHCCGIETCSYIFSFPGQTESFAQFDASLMISIDQPGFAESSFMGSFHTPFLEYPGNRPHVCTWEVGGDQQVNRHILNERWAQLKNWIDCQLLDQAPSPLQNECVQGLINDFVYIHSQQSGYFIWEKEVGDYVAADEPYITFYDPATSTFTSYAEKKPFIFISKYTIGAVGEGEQIGELLWI